LPSGSFKKANDPHGKTWTSLTSTPRSSGGKLNATTILLEPLVADNAVRLLDKLVGPDVIPRQARSRILEAAEGNPLFVE
jgi:predicted ATPase